MTKKRNRDRRVRVATLRLIEAEIRQYHVTRRMLAEMEETICAPKAVEYGEPLIAVGHGDPTASKAIVMMTSAELCEVRRRLEAIEYMLNVLAASPEPGRLELIRLRYWDRRLTDKGICERLNISERTLYRWRREALELAAERLGWSI